MTDSMVKGTGDLLSAIILKFYSQPQGDYRAVSLTETSHTDLLMRIVRIYSPHRD